MSEIREILSNNLVELRRSIGLTQSELAAKAGFQSKSYSRWETGKSWPEPETIQALAKALGVSEARLFQASSSSDISPREAIKTLTNLLDRLNL